MRNRVSLDKVSHADGGEVTRQLQLEPVMHFGAHLERAPTVGKQASPGRARHERRPGSCVHHGPSPERATDVVTPLQGLVGDGRFSQGVALGWLVAGPLVLKASSFAKFMTGFKTMLLSVIHPPSNERSSGKTPKSANSYHDGNSYAEDVSDHSYVEQRDQ